MKRIFTFFLILFSFLFVQFSRADVEVWLSLNEEKSTSDTYCIDLYGRGTDERVITNATLSVLFDSNSLELVSCSKEGLASNLNLDAPSFPDDAKSEYGISEIYNSMVFNSRIMFLVYNSRQNALVNISNGSEGVLLCEYYFKKKNIVDDKFYVCAELSEDANGAETINGIYDDAGEPILMKSPIDKSQIIEIVSKQQQSIAFNFSTNLTYGVSPIKLNGVSSSSLPVSYVVSAPSIAKVAGDILTIYNSGEFTITASQSGNDVYEPAADIISKIVVNKADLLVKAVNNEKYVGDANPEFEYTLSGFVNGEDSAVLLGQPSVLCNATAESPVGEYCISVIGGSAANYNFIYENGIFVVKESLVKNNNPVVVSHTGDIKMYVGESCEHNLSSNVFEDTDSDDFLTYSISGLPVGLAFDVKSLIISGTPSVKGVYNISFIATDKYGLIAVDEFVIEVLDKLLSTKNIDNINVLLYPNPAIDYLEVKTTDKINFSILNSLGIVLYNENISSNKNIDIRNYPRGTYIAKIIKGSKIKIYKLIFG